MGQVDISGLKLKKVDKTDWDQYPAGGGGPIAPPHLPGRYYFKVPDVKDMQFEAKDGDLVCIMDLSIENPEAGKDAILKFERISTKPYQKGKRKGATRAGDFLRACGSDAKPGSDPQEWADAIAECALAVGQCWVDWDCYDSEGEVSLADSYDDFPDDPNKPGEKLPYIVKGEGEKARRFRARQRIRSYVHGENAPF
jgi:hypothetical protein